jgi:hypothetical protein
MKHPEFPVSFRARLVAGASALTLGLAAVPTAHAALSFHVAIRRPSAIRPVAVRPARPVLVRTSAPVVDRWYSGAPHIVVGGASY